MEGLRARKKKRSENKDSFQPNVRGVLSPGQNIQHPQCKKRGLLWLSFICCVVAIRLEPHMWQKNPAGPVTLESRRETGSVD